MKKLKKLFIISCLILLALQVVVFAYPQKTAAITTGQWVSRSTIKIGNVTYFDNKTDNKDSGGSYTYQRQSDPDSCVDKIVDIRDGNTTATLVVRTPIAANKSECNEKDEPIKLSPASKSYIFFVWNDTSTLATSDQRNTYKKAADGLYYEVGGDNCKDTIETTGLTSGKLIVRTDGDETSFDDPAYRDGPNAINLSNPRERDGCELVYDPVKIVMTSEENASSAPGSVTPPGGEDQNQTATKPSCENRAGVMWWILCPIILGIDAGLELVDTQIRNLLNVDANQFNNDGVRKATATIRNLAFIIAVPMMLVMVLGTALGFELVSAYTVKKALPRLVIAIIFISLSFPITTFLINVSNDIGNATLGFITFPFGPNVGTLSLGDLFSPATGGGGVLSGILLLPKLAVGLVGLAVILWLFGSTILLFAAVGFLVLMVRQMFLVLLVLLAPLAILAWVFPGNDKLWKAWWSLFSKLLIMFPLIMALIASGRIFAWIINEGNSSSFSGDIVAPIGKLVAYMVPYAMIPLTFKFAGGIFSQVAGFMDNKQKGMFDRAKVGRAAKVGRLKAGDLPTALGGQKLGGLTSALSSGPRGWKGGRASMRGYRESQRSLTGQEAVEANGVWQSHKNDDKFLAAHANEAVATEQRNAALANGDTAQVAAWDQAIATAKLVPRTSATRMASAQAWAATGYNLDAGKKGYHQLSDTMAAITGASVSHNPDGTTTVTGPGATAYRNAMNNAQFGLKNAGRFDLAGINDGAGYDAAAGIGKVDPYTMASRAKPETIKAKGELMRDAIAAGNFEAAEIHRAELETGWDAATGKNKDTFLQELESVSDIGPAIGPPTPAQAAARALSAWKSTPTGGTKNVRKNYVAPAPGAAPPAGWEPEEIARGWKTVAEPETNADLARKKARGARRPNPAELEET